MNITKAFVDHMESLGFGTFGTDLFIGSAPLQSPDSCWWVIRGGGSPIVKAVTGQKMKAYIFSVFYRDLDGENFEDKLQEFEEAMNDANCDDITGYNKVELEASTFPADQDLDIEDRSVALTQVTLTTYL